MWVGEDEWFGQGRLCVHRMRDDKELKKVAGWVRDMYAFSVACALKPGGPMEFELVPELMLHTGGNRSLQKNGKNVSLLHYTYAADFNEEGKPVPAHPHGFWHFDKREYSPEYPPKNIMPPPENVDSPSVRALIAVINEASAAAGDRSHFLE